ncbi:trypsin-like peptidase domain-containing protein [Oceanicaulis alexandrii]|uniref:trypsin-like peptidase domain-containing protein n=1 Tax=Oceanicaulis alexandrii TaxID=153233 RepID=UPI002356B0E2|nr:trypsin-like peptidase domain-containing protein [Oceanicaulis alexandrii]
MKLTKRLILSATVAALSLGAATTAVVSAQEAPSAYTYSAPNGAPMSFASLIERVSPAVVSIEAEGSVDAGDAPDMSQLPPQFREFFERFGGMPDQPRERRAQGSGFFISADGYVVTNNHVIDGADTIRVVLTDGRSLVAEVVGTDVPTDLALLRVEEEDEPFAFVELDRDLEIRVGDWVVAFGLGGTATAGIISATGRQMGASQAYTDFLQIDAPINRGNSGGPAFDLDGQVVGVNSAIISPTGGNVGIGFAIPSDLAATVIDQLIENGEVRRGYLGISPAVLTADLKDAMGLDSDLEGVLINQVLDDTPAQAAGLENGDIILQINGEAVDDPRELTRVVGAFAPGERVAFRILRDERERTIRVELTERPESAAPQERAQREAGAAAQFGLALSAPTEAESEQLELEGRGLLVQGVRPGSEAAEKGLRPGDVILEAGGRDLVGLSDFEAAVEDARARDRRALLVFVVSQNGQRRYAALEMPSDETEEE